MNGPLQLMPSASWTPCGVHHRHHRQPILHDYLLHGGLHRPLLCHYRQRLWDCLASRHSSADSQPTNPVGAYKYIQ